MCTTCYLVRGWTGDGVANELISMGRIVGDPCIAITRSRLLPGTSVFTYAEVKGDDGSFVFFSTLPLTAVLLGYMLTFGRKYFDRNVIVYVEVLFTI